jgi:PAS domain S-box-containing protein
MNISPASRAFPRDRLLPALWAYWSLYGVWTVAMLAGVVPRGLTNDFLFFPLYLAAGLSCWHGARAHSASPSTARGWRLVGVAWLTSALGAALMSIAWAGPVPALDVASTAAYQLYFVFALLGFWRLMRLPAGAAARARLVVDGLIVVVATSILAWYWVFRFDIESSALLNYLKLLLVMFPGELAVALGAVCIVHQPAEASARRALSFLSVATITAVVADFIYEYHALIGAAWAGPVGDLILGFAAVLVATAGLSNPRSSGGSALSLGLALAPYMATALVGALAICEWWLPDTEHPALAGLVLGGAILMGLMIARLVVAQKEFAREASARAEQDARFRALVQQSSDATLLVDRQGVIRYASPAFGVIVGAPEASYVGRRLAALVSFDPPDGLDAWLASPEARPLVRWTIADRAIEATATDHSADPAIGGIVISARDVTRRARLEAQLQQAQKMEAVGRFASSVAHDFNNVLTVIGGNLEFLRLTGAGQSSELDQVQAAADRGAALARQLTALSRPRAATAGSVDLVAAVAAVDHTLGLLLPSSIQGTVILPDSVLTVGLDEVQAEQILLNLALNSRDAMPDGGQLVIRLSECGPPPDATEGQRGPWACLTVSDTGTGMSADVMARAFEPFFSTKEPSRGTGLGLASVREIVAAANGRVALDSQLNAGTTVTVLLPLVGDLARDSGDRPKASVPDGQGHVLVVDDEAAVRQIVARYLSRVGYEVEEREDGLAAVDYLNAHPGEVQLVLTDLVMPRMSGVELASRVAEQWPQIRVLLMSGTPGVMEGRSEPWASAPVITKPVVLAEVAQRIAEALRAEPV